MTDEPEQLTWETLVLYLQERIEGTTNHLEEMRREFGDLEELEQTIQGQIDRLKWLVPLVDFMPVYPKIGRMTPLLSMEFIRLFRSHSPRLSLKEEFAWIIPIAEGTFELWRVRYKSPMDYDREAVCIGGIAEIEEHLEKLS